MLETLPLRIFLIGFIASGKTTIGKSLSYSLNYKFIDTDEEIEKKENIDLGEFIKRKGERFFREVEWGIIKRLKDEEKAVIALSSGAGASKSIMDFIKRIGLVIYLNPQWSIIAKRIEEKKKLLPDKINIEELYSIYLLRNKIYKKADIVVNFYGDENIGEIVKRIERLIRETYEVPNNI